MANQRPIRRRPWARPPWRARRQNRRWIDCNSSVLAEENCGVDTVPLGCLPNTPRELVVGDLDIDWSDKSEVTIQRVVGSIALSGESIRTAAGLAPYATLVRFGMLVVEDTDRLYQTINLGDPESLEEFEWMWLHNQILDREVYLDGTLGAVTSATIPLDIRVKRKLGKKDALVLYAQHGLHIFAPASFTFSTSYSIQARVVLT